MSQHDWSRILKIQDQFVHDEDQRQKSRKLRIKQIYKNQLQKMIQNNRYHNRDQKEFDKKLVNEAYQKNQRRIIQQEKHRLEKMRIKQKLADENLKETFMRRQKTVQEEQEKRKFYNSNFKRAETQISQQNEMKIKNKQKEKTQLSNAYESQIHLQRNKRVIQRLQDEKFVKLQQEIERKKEEERKYFMNKIKSSYKQNPQVYERSANLISQHENERNNFVEKIVKLDRSQEQLRQKLRMQEEKNKQIKQASSYNKRYYENKAMRDRYQSLQQIADYNSKYRKISQQIQEEKEHQSRFLQIKRKQLKKQLESQINQYHRKQKLKHKMSDEEYLLNRSGNITALPGLSRDYKSQKQHKILQNFLIGNSNKKLQF